MPSQLNISGNDVKNGYIYTELNNRMVRIESDIKKINNLMNVVSLDGITMQSFIELTTRIDKLSDLEYVNGHINDTEVHTSSIEKFEWQNKYTLPTDGIPETDLDLEVKRKLNLAGSTTSGGFLKYKATIGNNTLKSFVLRHNFNTEDVIIQIIDSVTKQIVFVDCKILDRNSVRVDFESPPTINEFNAIIMA